jgi:EAL domain-containing protein (putative c-di-GMP-specific phosphodiesterase class I)
VHDRRRCGERAALEFLRQWDSDLVQGYHLSRPQPPDRLVSWLLERQPSLSRITARKRATADR